MLIFLFTFFWTGEEALEGIDVQIELFQLRIEYRLKSQFLLVQDYSQLILDLLLEAV